MQFKVVQGADKNSFEEAVNEQLDQGYVFAGNIVFSSDGQWSMPMVQFSAEEGMDTRLAKQLWGMFIARLF